MLCSKPKSKRKEIENNIRNFSKIKEVEINENGDYIFYLETTVPDRTSEILPDGTEIKGEILDKQVLEKHKDFINNKSSLGGDYGSYRTVGLFHDRVYHPELKLEEAGFIRPNAEVVPMSGDYDGHYALQVTVGVNDMYTPNKLNPDYTPEKIKYKIENDVLGLSVEYNNRPDQEKIIELNGDRYRYVMDSDIFKGASFARADLIGNPTAIRIKEIQIAKDLNKNIEGDNKMADENTPPANEGDENKKKLEQDLQEAEDKIKELKAQINKSDSSKVKELEKQQMFFEDKVKEIRLRQDDFASKIKESLDLAFQNIKVKQPIKGNDESKVDMKIKEVMNRMFKIKETEIEYSEFNSICDSKIKEQEDYLKKELKKGFDFEENQTLKVKCVGRRMVVVPTAKTKEVMSGVAGIKTKDMIDSNDMTEATYYQTNAMFADRYVPGITETFLKDDTLLTAMIKESFVGGNDKYQWRIWTEFDTFTGSSTLAVDPNTVSVSTTQYDFIKLETPIREYRQGIEVTDFVQAHSAGAIGDLMGQEIQRAAEVVTNSMSADLYKQYIDSASGWFGFNGLLGIADSGTYTSMYGRTRSAANRLLDATTANTYVSTSEDVSVSIIRNGYEKVLAHGSSLADIAIVTSPTQTRRLFNTEDAAIRNNQLTMAGAPPTWGFSRAMIPYLDGIPIIRDYRCVDASGNADTFAVVDLGPNGFVLVVSKPLGIRGLAKVGTSEKAYVSFWGQAVYKRPRNVFLHDSLTLT